MTSIPHPVAPQLTIGVDTHLDLHVAHANDQLGRPVATIQIPTTPAGYSSCWPGPTSSVSRSSGAWRAPAATALGWPASWLPTTRSWSRSTEPTVKPGA